MKSATAGDLFHLPCHSPIFLRALNLGNTDQVRLLLQISCVSSAEVRMGPAAWQVSPGRWKVLRMRPSLGVFLVEVWGLWRWSLGGGGLEVEMCLSELMCERP